MIILSDSYIVLEETERPDYNLLGTSIGLALMLGGLTLASILATLLGPSVIVYLLVTRLLDQPEDKFSWEGFVAGAMVCIIWVSITFSLFGGLLDVLRP
jgi:peptidoglycan biosynthesis protein MviN/MurJ (putative lipid II flippase)